MQKPNTASSGLSAPPFPREKGSWPPPRASGRCLSGAVSLTDPLGGRRGRSAFRHLTQSVTVADASRFTRQSIMTSLPSPFLPESGKDAVPHASADHWLGTCGHVKQPIPSSVGPDPQKAMTRFTVVREDHPCVPSPSGRGAPVLFLSCPRCPCRTVGALVAVVRRAPFWFHSEDNIITTRALT